MRGSGRPIALGAEYRCWLESLIPDQNAVDRPRGPPHLRRKAMTQADAITAVRTAMEKMNTIYGEVVFDEWAMLAFGNGKAGLIAYEGNRKESFKDRFSADIEGLRDSLTSGKHGTGDFEFARDAPGTFFDAFIVLGERIFLICNHTARSMEDITRSPLWSRAQVSFFNLANRFRDDPLTLS